MNQKNLLLVGSFLLSGLGVVLFVHGNNPEHDAVSWIGAFLTGFAVVGICVLLGRDFFTFRKMITPNVIGIVYVLGVIGIVYSGVSMLNSHGSILPGMVGDYLIPGIVGFNEWYGWGLLIFGNLFWRMYCELVTVLFNIHETLVNTDKNTAKTAENTQTFINALRKRQTGASKNPPS